MCIGTSRIVRERTIQSEGVYADVRPLKVGHDQAQEGDRRRPAARRGKPFARLIKNIELGARTGGGDPAGNPTLYDAIQKAKRNSVPNENIDRAQKRGAGLEGDGADYQSLMFEGYGPSGVGILIECLTDNRNRAATEVRTALTRNGGSLAEPGAVSYLFARKGVVIVPKGKLSEDEVGAAVRDAGAEEVNDLGESFEVVSEPTDLTSVRTALQSAEIADAWPPLSAHACRREPPCRRGSIKSERHLALLIRPLATLDSGTAPGTPATTLTDDCARLGTGSRQHPPPPAARPGVDTTTRPPTACSRLPWGLRSLAVLPVFVQRIVR